MRNWPPPPTSPVPGRRQSPPRCRNTRKGCDGSMAYTVIPLQIDEHRDALRRLWRDNSYDPETNVCAAERFDWLYRDNGGSEAQTWLAIDSQSQNVIGCGSVFRSNRSFR